MKRLTIFVLISFFSAAWSLQSAVEEPQFTRLVKSPDTHALQVSVVTYQPRTGGDLKVDLVGAIHVGDKAYYEALNNLFESYDAVLFEAVMPEGARIPKGGHEKLGMISNVQDTMASFLDLSFQMREVNYTLDHFVHADLSPSEFSQSMDDKKESILGIVLQMMKADMVKQITGEAPVTNTEMLLAMLSPDRANEMKKLVARLMLDTESLNVIGGSEGSTIITERNKKALQVLDREIKKGKQYLAIFYGAGHMPDFHERLVADFDLVPVKTAWIDAWSLKD